MNFYTVGIEGMPRLLLDIEAPMENFKKNTYAGAFKKYYEKNLVVYEAIENGHASVIDKEQFLQNMADALVDAAGEKVYGLPKKSQQEKLLVDYNISMAVYVLPAVLEFGGESSKKLADKLVKAWKKKFPKTNIQASEYENIEKGFHKKWCYITTAVCESFGKPDDCYELTLLRNYRDNFLMGQPDGEAVIKEYYDVAPTIVKHINKHKNHNDIYKDVWNEYLRPCIQMIEENENGRCKELYIRMVRELKEKYFYVN